MTWCILFSLLWHQPETDQIADVHLGMPIAGIKAVAWPKDKKSGDPETIAHFPEVRRISLRSQADKKSVLTVHGCFLKHEKGKLTQISALIASRAAKPETAITAIEAPAKALSIDKHPRIESSVKEWKKNGPPKTPQAVSLILEYKVRCLIQLTPVVSIDAPDGYFWTATVTLYYYEDWNSMKSIDEPTWQRINKEKAEKKNK